MTFEKRGKRCLLLATLAGLFLAVFFCTIKESKAAEDAFRLGDDRIYIFSQHGEDNPGGDMILVASNGYYGLIDASNNAAETITGEDGTVYHLSEEDAVFDPVNNGVSYAKYMIDTLGITHLDFIVGTHSHSDHIGGVPEIAKLEYNGVRLVDSSTVYFYKTYYSLNYLEDDVWMNGAFAYQAEKTMKEQGAVLADLSQGLYAGQVEKGIKPNYYLMNRKLRQVPAIGECSYDPGEEGNAYDDTFSFTLGDFSVRFYNLFTTDSMINENVNSICTLITKGSENMVLLADINNDQRTAQKTALAISEDLQGNPVTVLKDAHHGTPRGSNTKEEADLYRPVYDISSKAWENSAVSNNFANFKYYLESEYGTVFYASGDAEHALCVSFEEDGVQILQVSGEEEAVFSEAAVNDRIPDDGWHLWDYEYNAYNTDHGMQDWYWFEDGAPVTGFHEIQGYRYYFDQTGVMQTGWIRVGRDWYYMNGNGKMQTGWHNGYGEWGAWYFLDPADGKMHTGWLVNNENRYYFDLQGAMLTGWQMIDGKRCCFSDDGTYHDSGWVTIGGIHYYLQDGEYAHGWLKDGKDWYYLDPETGERQTGWCEVDGQWHYLNADGVMQTGWTMVDGKWYYLTPETGERQSGWLKDGGKWYYLDEDGVMTTGWLELDQKWYFFYNNGVMMTGWAYDGQQWFYLNSGGDRAEGWKKLGGYWYYFKPDGAMAEKEWFGGYWFGSGGKWTYAGIGSWKKGQKGWWFGDTLNWYAKNETLRIDGVDCRFDAAGYLVP